MDMLRGFPIIITLPVQWGDQDALGHVNNTVYLRWFESSRIAYFERIGLSTAILTEKIGPILASISCDYRRQIRYPETVHAGARINRIGSSSLAMEHEVVCESSRALSAVGGAVIVIFDYRAQQSHPIPDRLRREIEALEGKSF
jgi:acyl-CoA thioester hydrolase